MRYIHISKALPEAKELNMEILDVNELIKK